MTLDGFLTFLTLLIAVYALAPPVARLSAKLRLAVQAPLAVGALLFVLYLLFFEPLGQPCPTYLGSTCDWLVFPPDNSVTPPDAAFLVVLIWSAFAWTIHKFYRPGAGSLPDLSRLVDDLVYEQRFSEVLKLLKPHLPLIGRAGRRDLPLQRFHDRLAALKGDDFGLLMRLAGYKLQKIGTDADRSPIIRRLRRFCGKLAVLIPGQRRAETAAGDIARVLFRSTDLMEFIVQMRPYFAIPLLQLELHGMREFSSAYFRALISNPGSVLYQELRQNQNLNISGGYRVPESNRLLHFLFADAQIAKQLGVSKPIGDHLLKILRTDGPQEYIESLNDRADFSDDDQWQDPLFVGMRFFDVMVSTAAYQGVPGHMWLLYLYYIVERLAENYDASNPKLNISNEFPNRSSRIIYEGLDALGDWVEMATKLPAESPHCQIPSQYSIYDIEGIPGWAAISLGRSMRAIAMSDQIGEKFAGYMHEVVMQRISNLPLKGSKDQIRKFLIDSLIRGGQFDADRVYGDRLGTFFCMADHILQDQVGDYKKAIQKAYPGVLP